ncbi:MAG TPA: RNA polymerase sigma factor [Ktedonobacterales bacterium]|nr:RNA polymerase sigma factor [Ktedonobacterales bacterium]
MGDGDTELAALLATDPRQHFQRLVEAYQHRLYAFAFRLTRSQQDAEDIAQEAFVRAYLACVTYPAARTQALNLRPWLYKIALNEFRHHMRGARLQLTPLDLTDDSPSLAIEDTADERPDMLVESQERRQKIEAAITRLPDRYRLPLLCCYFEGMTYRETADLLDQPLGTVKSAIARGVALLRTMLTEPEIQGEGDTCARTTSQAISQRRA